MKILKLTQVEEVILIYHQILLNNLQGNELKLEGRIDHQILRIKGLNVKSSVCWICIHAAQRSYISVTSVNYSLM